MQIQLIPAQNYVYPLTPNYIVPKPILYDKKILGLIESYHYVFYKNDFDFFKKLNPTTNLKTLEILSFLNL